MIAPVAATAQLTAPLTGTAAQLSQATGAIQEVPAVAVRVAV